MQTFDCLSVATEILGPHFLEASAGTGKTFAIEHVVARLLLSKEPVFELEQILIVTFTRAATRELRLRIRKNLEKIQAALRDGNVLWDYMGPCIGSADALRRIDDALAIFDRAQIYTIHSFCSQMLTEFSLESGVGFVKKGGADPLDEALEDFFESGLSSELICPEQMGILVKEKGSVGALAKALKSAISFQPVKSYSQLLQEFELAWASIGVCSKEKLMEDFEAIRGGYKAEVKGRFQAQVEALGQSAEAAFRTLIGEKGSLFRFLSPDNRKLRGQRPQNLHDPDSFDRASKALLPLVEQASDPKRIFHSLLGAWIPIQERIQIAEEAQTHDSLLQVMAKAVQDPAFSAKVTAKYRAALVDEFQDTDSTQWAIFSSLFLRNSMTFYLVGDPKQSIYRFRRADLYTYLQAKERFNSSQQYRLDTNFRSSKELVDSLNRLFDRDWLKLPQKNLTIPYLPVQSGAQREADFCDGKGPAHCFEYEGDKPDQAYDYIASEIVRLGRPLGSIAVLVKDRYSAADLQETLSKSNIPSIARSQELLARTLAFESFWELFDALAHPKHLGRAKTVLAGPFSGMAFEELKDVRFSPFVALREVLDQKGFASFCATLWKTKLGKRTVQEELASRGRDFYSSICQMLELLLKWSSSEGFSLEGCARFLERVERDDSEEAPSVKKEANANAVQIMTMHVSKGLEFEIVFALGLASRTPEGDEEGNAEKMRQLYVAMTRAKDRLYIPIPKYKKEGQEGTLSPIELFERFGKDALNQLTTEKVAEISPSACKSTEDARAIKAPYFDLPAYEPAYVRSFSSLVEQAPIETLEPLPSLEEGYTMHNLPRGAETGVLIHNIMERFFRSGEKEIEGAVDETLSITGFAPWKNAVKEMIAQVLKMPLPMGFCLRDIDPTRALVETEFLFSDRSNPVKGFVDLVFEHEKRLYIVDWKTNWLGKESPAYTDSAMQKSIRDHQYDLQARLYAESLRRAVGAEFQHIFGGALYVFVRGPKAVLLTGLESWS